MGWDLVARTTSGFKKFIDSYGNGRYMDPSGTFTNQNAWAGTASQGADIVDLSGDTGITDVTPGKIFDIIDREDLENYEDMTDYVIQETGKTIGGYEGIEIQVYPGDRRKDQLETRTESDSGDFGMFTWGVHTILYDTNTREVIEKGQRFVSHNKPDSAGITILRKGFGEILRELAKIPSESPGVGLLITKTVAKGMNYWYDA